MKDKTRSRRRTVRLAAGHHLQRDPAGSGHLLISPTGSVQLNESAAAILALCDGTQTREEIVAKSKRLVDCTWHMERTWIGGDSDQGAQHNRRQAESRVARYDVDEPRTADRVLG